MRGKQLGNLLFVGIVVVSLFIIARNARRRWLNNALAEAVAVNNVAGVRSLLEQGANPNQVSLNTSEPGPPVLQIAVQNGNANITRLLLDKGADLRLIRGGGQSLMTLSGRT